MGSARRAIRIATIAKRHRVRPEAELEAARGDEQAGDRRGDDPEQVVLRGVERHRVADRLAGNDRRDDGLVRGLLDGERQPGEDGEDEHVPVLDDPEGRERRKHEGEERRRAVGPDQEEAPIDPVREDAGEEREKQRGKAERGPGQPEQARRVGELQDEPALGRLAHERADRREDAGQQVAAIDRDGKRRECRAETLAARDAPPRPALIHGRMGYAADPSAAGSSSRSTVMGPMAAPSRPGRIASASPTSTMASSSGRMWRVAAPWTSASATASIEGR